MDEDSGLQARYLVWNLIIIWKRSKVELRKILADDKYLSGRELRAFKFGLQLGNLIPKFVKPKSHLKSLNPTIRQIMS